MLAEFCTHVLLVAQTRGKIVVVVPVVLSRNVAVAQSKRTVSGQVILYQNEIDVLPEGAVNVRQYRSVLPRFDRTVEQWATGER